MTEAEQPRQERSSTTPSHEQAAVIEVDTAHDPASESQPGFADSGPTVTPIRDATEVEVLPAEHDSNSTKHTEMPDMSDDVAARGAKQTSPAIPTNPTPDPQPAIKSSPEASQPLSAPQSRASTELDDIFLPPSGPTCIDLTGDSDDEMQGTSPSSYYPTTTVKSEPLPNLPPEIDLELDPVDPENQDFMNVSHGAYPRSESVEEIGTNIQHEGVEGQNLDMVAMLQAFNNNTANMVEDEAYIDRNDVDSDEEDARATKAFEEVRAAYEEKCAAGWATPGDKLDYTTAKLKEEERKRLRKDKLECEEDTFRREHDMFFPDEQAERARSPSTSSDVFITHATSDDVESQNNMQGYRAASEVDSAPDNETSERKPIRRGRGSRSTAGTSRKLPSRDKVTKPQSKSRGGATRGRGPGRKKLEPSLFDMRSLAPYNIISAANKNANAEPQIAVTSTTRKDALAELIASIPHEQQDLHVNDKKLLEDSLKQFRTSRSMIIDQGSWRLRGMKTSLRHFQTVGVGRMRQRETGGEPHGGILADEMGLGKTVMTIANIIDGRPLEKERTRATLIVAPNAILTQWHQQIHQHSGDYPSMYMIFRSKDKAALGNDPAKALSNFDVVITSYHELIHSMPKREYPPQYSTAEAREQWWQKHFDENKGFLHQVKWHRVILDEAQQIKNYTSHTSEAAWRIKAKYRWAITGTPVLNGLKEFYAYFRFLEVKNTGSFELWSQNYCKRGSTNALKRLNTMLQKFMIRRTHKDEMFGRPIITLPNVSQYDMYLEFNHIERAVYKIIQDRFTAKIAGFKRAKTVDKNYTFIFVLMLRLRQLTANILLIQKTMKDLLEPEDIQKLLDLTDASQHENVDDTGRQLLMGLRHGLRNVSPDDNTRQIGTNLSSINRENATMETPDIGGAATERFRKYLHSLRKEGAWEALGQASICHMCQMPPQRPYITPCCHIYCHGCVQQLAEIALTAQETRVTCAECGKQFIKAEAYPADTEITGQRSRRTPLSNSNRQSRSSSDATGHEESIDWLTLPGPVLHSTKVIASVNKMKEWFEADPAAKVLIFTQWRAMIKIFMLVCRENKWGQAVYHGGMEMDARDDAIRRFSESEKCRILIAGMRSGGVGLNLPAANKVILIDLWWNSGLETQAFCRAFRIGQKREVEIVRLIANDTIDAEMVKMQKAKDAEIASVMDASNRRGGRLTSQQLLALFGLDGDDEGGDGDADRYLIAQDGDGDGSEDFEMPDS